MKRSRVSHPWGKGRHCTLEASWGSERRGHHPIISDAKAPHRPVGWNLSVKKVVHTCWGGPRAGQVWKKKQDNWPKVNKDPEELPYRNDLTTSLLHSSSLGGMPTPFLSWCVSLPRFCLNSTNCFSVCSPTCCTMALIINFVPVSTLFASLRNAFLNGGKSQGNLVSSLSPLVH